jgi:flagellar biogenesis protein FliO
MPIMLPPDNPAPKKNALPNWLLIGVLGLAATGAGLFLPHSREEGSSPPAAIPARARESWEYSPPALPDLPTSGAMFLRLGLGTVFVLILCPLTLWAGKRWIRPLAVPPSANKHLSVIETLSLGGRSSIYLLQAGEAKVLAGVDGAGIKALLPLPPAFDGMMTDLLEPAGVERAAALAGRGGLELP